MNAFSRRLVIPAILLSVLAAAQVVSPAQQDDDDNKPASPLAKAGTRFNFDIIECFDAKYLGDTPGHMGRAGGLIDVRPRIALGDPVYREDTKIGHVSTVLWARVQGSLTIEIDPIPLTRICVGDRVWVDLNPSNPPEPN